MLLGLCPGTISCPYLLLECDSLSSTLQLGTTCINREEHNVLIYHAELVLQLHICFEDQTKFRKFNLEINHLKTPKDRCAMLNVKTKR